jgi:hypothetical protein
LFIFYCFAFIFDPFYLFFCFTSLKDRIGKKQSVREDKWIEEKEKGGEKSKNTGRNFFLFSSLFFFLLFMHLCIVKLFYLASYHPHVSFFLEIKKKRRRGRKEKEGTLIEGNSKEIRENRKTQGIEDT